MTDADAETVMRLANEFILKVCRVWCHQTPPPSRVTPNEWADAMQTFLRKAGELHAAIAAERAYDAVLDGGITPA